MSILFLQSSDGEERAGCFAQFVLLMSRDCNVAHPHNATGLCAVFDCGIFWSYSLIFRINSLTGAENRRAHSIPVQAHQRKIYLVSQGNYGYKKSGLFLEIFLC